MTPYRRAPDAPDDAPRVPLTWTPREPPLPVRGVALRGAAAVAVCARLGEADEATLRALRGVAAGADVVLLGDAPPWAPDGVWLGRDDDAPGWLVPTATRPSVPLPLLLRALASRGVPSGQPHALWPTAEGLRVVPLGEARALSRARLRAWGGAAG
ncbi:MAG: hypothetical protein U0325_09465 [Polyangiales bacterium]